MSIYVAPLNGNTFVFICLLCDLTWPFVYCSDSENDRLPSPGSPEFVFVFFLLNAVVVHLFYDLPIMFVEIVFLVMSGH